MAQVAQTKKNMEKHIEAYIRNKVKKMGGLALKWVSPGFTGVPDRIIFLPGRPPFFIETKFGKNGLSPRQAFVHRQLKNLGVTVFTISTKLEADEIFTKALPKAHDATDY